MSETGQASTARRGILIGAAAYLSWGTLSPGNEIILREVTPMWMQAFRTILAAVVATMVFGLPTLRRAFVVLQQGAMVRALFFGTFLSFALFAWAQGRGLPAAFTTLGFYTAPLWTGILARIVLGERVGRSFPVVVAAILVGGWLALTGGGRLGWPDTVGLLLAVASGVTWAIYAVLLRRDSIQVPWRDLLVATMLLALPLFAVLAMLTEPTPDLASWSRPTWTWTIINAVLPTIVSLGLFQVSLRLAPASHINILVGLELASTVFFAWLLLGASFSPVQMAGLGIVLASVSLYLWRRTARAERRLGSPV